MPILFAGLAGLEIPFFVICLLLFAIGIAIFLTAKLLFSYPLVLLSILFVCASSVFAIKDGEIILGAIWLLFSAISVITAGFYYYKNVRGSFWWSLGSVFAMIGGAVPYSLFLDEEIASLAQLAVPFVVFFIIGFFGSLIGPRVTHKEKAERNHLTNTDPMIGELVKIEKDPDGEFPARGTFGDVDWAIAPLYPFETFKAGDIVKVHKIQGVTLLCTRYGKDYRAEMKEKRNEYKAEAKAKAKEKAAAKAAKKVELEKTRAENSIAAAAAKAEMKQAKSQRKAMKAANKAKLDKALAEYDSLNASNKLALKQARAERASLKDAAKLEAEKKRAEEKAQKLAAKVEAEKAKNEALKAEAEKKAAEEKAKKQELDKANAIEKEKVVEAKAVEKAKAAKKAKAAEEKAKKEEHKKAVKEQKTVKKSSLDNQKTRFGLVYIILSILIFVISFIVIFAVKPKTIQNPLIVVYLVLVLAYLIAIFVLEVINNKKPVVVEETTTVEEQKVEEQKVEETPVVKETKVDEPVNKKEKAEFVPFATRLKEADESVREAYNEIKSEILSYGIKSRVSTTGDTFRLHTKEYVKVVIAGKILKLYMALDPKDYVNSTYPFDDASRMTAHQETPFVFKISSGLSVRRAKVLINELATKNGLVQGEIVKHDHASDVI